MRYEDKGNPFGEVSTYDPSYIVIEVPLTPLYVESREPRRSRNQKFDPHNKHQDWYPVLVTRDRIPASLQLAFDYTIRNPRDLTLRAAVIAYSRKRRSYSVLVITPLDDAPSSSKRYSRVGYMEINEGAFGSWDPNAAEQREIQLY
jgi:hypothetical protein